VKEFKYIVDNVSSLLVHLDIAHAFTSGGMHSIIDFITTFHERIVHVHWHDNHGKRDEHLPVGQGTIDHEKAVKALKEVGYNKTITLEVFTNSNDAKFSMNQLNVLWAKP
jgi:sugar phosphate isomerase/epimerase